MPGDAPVTSVGEPALKLPSEASTPIDKGRRPSTSGTTAPDSALRFDDNGATLAASLNGLMRRGGVPKREARRHRQDAARHRGPGGDVGLCPLAVLVRHACKWHRVDGEILLHQI